VTEYRPALTDLFAAGHEVLAFGDFDELASQATRLLRDGLSAKLGDAAALARPAEPHLRKAPDRTAREIVLIAAWHRVGRARTKRED
jgi:spore maturation protein CgeB